MKKFIGICLLVSPLRAGDAHSGNAEVRVTIPHSPSINTLNMLDINGDGAIDEQEERMCEFAMSAYFYQRNVSRHRIVPRLRRRIRAGGDSPEERESLQELKQFLALRNVAELRDQRPLQVLQSMVLSATTEALQEIEKEAALNKQLADERWSRKKALITTLVSNGITALLGLTSSLLIYYMGGNNGSSQ